MSCFEEQIKLARGSATLARAAPPRQAARAECGLLPRLLGRPIHFGQGELMQARLSRLSALLTLPNHELSSSWCVQGGILLPGVPDHIFMTIRTFPTFAWALHCAKGLKPCAP
eukprot:1156796-Pelagomonas_calceolata.AAC.10